MTIGNGRLSSWLGRKVPRVGMAAIAGNSTDKESLISLSVGAASFLNPQPSCYERATLPEPSFRLLIGTMIFFAVFLGAIITVDYLRGDERLSMSASGINSNTNRID